ncbi:hypothetical protein HDV02_000125 [Globomyces sp. JEL0801]|nr:hypothetical protein HDV02_000125 [Globomyces sp. JEL0801]
MELSIPLTLKNIDIDWSNLNWKQITSYAAVIGGTIYLWNWYVGPSPRLPGPKGLPIVGNVAKLPLFLTGKSHVVFKEYRAKYGKIFRVPGIFSSRPMVVVSEAAEVKRMLTETDTFARDDMFESKVSGLLDHALFVYPTSERWKRHRKLLQPAFGPSHLKHASIVSLNAMQELNAIWDQTFMKSKTFEVDIYTIFTCITLDIIAKVAFGESLGSVQSIGSDKCSRWEDLDAISIDVIPSRFFIPEFLWNYFGAGLKSPKVALARKNVHEYLHRLIVKGREDLKEMPEGFNMNVLHRLLLSNEKGLMSEEEIIGELLGFFLAGHEYDDILNR